MSLDEEINLDELTYSTIESALGYKRYYGHYPKLISDYAIKQIQEKKQELKKQNKGLTDEELTKEATIKLENALEKDDKIMILFETFEQALEAKEKYLLKGYFVLTAHDWAHNHTFVGLAP